MPRRSRRPYDPQESQGDLGLSPIPAIASNAPLTAIDLFAGIGGLSSGFASEGFTVTGVDQEALAAEVFERAGFGSQVTLNLLEDLPGDLRTGEIGVIMGGPPCRPWSAVNLQRRRANHDDHGLLLRFAEHVSAIQPAVFIMENVPALGSDEIYTRAMGKLTATGYRIGAKILHYDRFGAATCRRRLFTVGIRDSRISPQTFFELLQAEEKPPKTVGDAIRWLRDKERHEVPDHDWSVLRSIENYRERYATGQFGWRRLDYGSPAPSFGSVAKTYILHPEAGTDGYPERVLSVREVLSIMGFDLSVKFPAGAARAKRYQMVANAVSPQVSLAVARVTRRLLRG